MFLLMKCFSEVTADTDAKGCKLGAGLHSAWFTCNLLTVSLQQDPRVKSRFRPVSSLKQEAHFVAGQKAPDSERRSTCTGQSVKH